MVSIRSGLFLILVTAQVMPVLSAGISPTELMSPPLVDRSLVEMKEGISLWMGQPVSHGLLRDAAKRAALSWLRSGPAQLRKLRAWSRLAKTLEHEPRIELELLTCHLLAIESRWPSGHENRLGTEGIGKDSPELTRHLAKAGHVVGVELSEMARMLLIELCRGLDSLSDGHVEKFNGYGWGGGFDRRDARMSVRTAIDTMSRLSAEGAGGLFTDDTLRSAGKRLRFFSLQTFNPIGGQGFSSLNETRDEIWADAIARLLEKGLEQFQNP